MLFISATLRRLCQNVVQCSRGVAYVEDEDLRIRLNRNGVRFSVVFLSSPDAPTGALIWNDNVLGCSTVMPSELEVVIFKPIPHPSPRSIQVVLVEAIGGVLWAALCWVLLLRIFAENAPRLPIVYSGLAILLGLVLSDFMGGFLHWFFDTFFEESTPFIGPHLITPFREHHRDPAGMTRHGFLELTGNSFLGYLLPLALVWWFAPANPQSQWGVFNYTWWVSLAIALRMPNQLHCWALQCSPPRFARWLQRFGLAISASHHARHHSPPYRSSYCITNGWTNRLADKFSVFARLEKLFVAV